MRNGSNKKFCLITPGRSGSTSLMKVIEGFNNVAVPNKNIQCPNNELVQPRYIKSYKLQYSDLCQTKIKTPRELVDQFFLYNKVFDYVGFKTMPNRHRSDPGFLFRKDIQFIVLVREDIPSTVASFLAARNRNSWSRTGGKNINKLNIKGLNKLAAWGNVRYVCTCMKLLKKINNPIHIKYEDLCDPDYNNSELDDFFTQPVKIDKPVPPTSGQEYVENWDEFKKFVERWVLIFGR